MGAGPLQEADLARVRLVATDLDGTLLDPSGRISERAIQAIAAARDMGVEVVPVTGRPPQALWELAETAGLGPFGICANGAALVDVESRTIIEMQPLAGEVAMGMVDLLRDALPGVLMACDSIDRFSYEPGFFDFPVDWEQNLQEVRDVRNAVTGGCIKLIARLRGTPAPELIELLQERTAELVHVTTSGFDWVDLGAPGVSKAYALERLCDRLDIHLSEVAAVGDNHNDLTFLGWAGLPMAPANAIPEVLALAQRVLPANHEDGVAKLLEEIAAARAGSGVGLDPAELSG